MMALPLAYFLSWTCYGQRLHGDARGSVDLSHNQRNTPYLPRDDHRNDWEHDVMSGEKVSLSDAMIPVVTQAINGLCIERRWFVLAINVRPTHVHLVVNCRGDLSPERAMAQCKARATKNLRVAGLAEADARLWTRHGSTRWINHRPGLVGAIVYVNEWQTGPNRELLESHKAMLREQFEALREWLRAQGFPESGLTVVAGESEEERGLRVDSERVGDSSGMEEA